MCGRLNVIDDYFVQTLCDQLGLQFNTTSNSDLRPSQKVDVIVAPLRQMQVIWGIQPSWSKGLIINAQSETVGEKKTFRKAFHLRRCLVPCNGWYEWCDEGKPQKQRYRFYHVDDEAMLMAGIWFEADKCNQLVTLTSNANRFYRVFHNRMPTLIPSDSAETWLSGTPSEASQLLQPFESAWLNAEAVA